MSLSFDLLGKPSLVTYVAVYPSSATMPSKERIVKRAEALVETYPLLKACVRDAKTTTPKWGILSADTLGRVASLVKDVRIQEVEDLGTRATENPQANIPRTLQNIFNRELQDKQSVKVASGGFLWRVVRYLGDPDATGTPDHRPAYIALTCNHVISDGRSGQRLLEALLSDTELESTKEKPKIAPSMQDTINCRPSLGFMLHQVWYEVIVPKLPRFVSRKLRMKPCWPAAPLFGGHVQDLEQGDQLAIDHIHLPADSLKQLKERGKANGVNTLHPTLQIAAAVALWIIVSDGTQAFDRSGRHSHPLRFDHATAASHRQSDLGHPDITGNYVGHLESSCAGDGDIDFWQTVRDYAAWLHSPATRRRGCQFMGSLRYIPDGIKDLSEGSLTPTGWESFFLERTQREPSDSFTSSNLGFYTLPPGSIRLAWPQTPIPGSPIQINIIGHTTGLDVDISRPAGACIDDSGHEPLERFAEMYEKVLVTLACVPLAARNKAEYQPILTFSDFNM